MTSSNCLFCLERLIALSPTTKESSKSPLELRDFFCIDFSLQLCLREYKTLNAPQSPDKHKPVQISPKLGNYFDINGHLLPLEPLSWLVVLSFFKFLVLNQEWTPTESQLYLMCFGFLWVNQKPMVWAVKNIHLLFVSDEQSHFRSTQTACFLYLLIDCYSSFNVYFWHFQVYSYFLSISSYWLKVTILLSAHLNLFCGHLHWFLERP